MTPDDLASRARRHADTHPESRELIEELLDEIDTLEAALATVDETVDDLLNDIPTPTPLDGCEAVWLQKGVVDHFATLVPLSDPAPRTSLITACRDAQARRSPATEPPPADDSEPPEVKRRTRREVTADFTEGTRTIREWVNGGGVHGPALCEELDAWLDYWGGSPPTPAPSPVPPWPGTVLSGLCDEDGVPTWLAQAGQVRGEQVRVSRSLPWANPYYADPDWVEVRAPRAVPVPETERVPWWEAKDRLGLAGDPFVEVGADDEGPWVRVVEGGTKLHSPVERGFVEVLKDGDR